jgi:hypothetical protein
MPLAKRWALIATEYDHLAGSMEAAERERRREMAALEGRHRIDPVPYFST